MRVGRRFRVSGFRESPRSAKSIIRRVPDHRLRRDPRRRERLQNHLAKREIFFLQVEGAALIARRASVAVLALPPVAMASRSALRRGIAAFADATRGVTAGNALARQGGVTANRYDAPA